MTTTDTLEWIDTRTELPPLRTSVAVLIQGMGVTTARLAVTANKAMAYRADGGFSYKPERVIAWCHLPAIPDWAKGRAMAEVVPAKSSYDADMAAVRFQNDKRIDRIAKGPRFRG